MAGHAKLAPSASARWIACPGSIRMSAGLQDVESDAAAEGTFAHLIASMALETGQTADRFVGSMSGDDKWTCTAEMADHVNEYIAAVRRCQDATNGTLHVEQSVRVSKEVYGTADAIVVSDDGFMVDVFDLKYGAGIYVDVRDNPQLLIYALGALRTYELDPAIVRIHVVQPRHYNGGHSSQTWFVEDLVAWGIRLAAAIERTKQKDAMLDAGSHCKFCLAKSKCPALRQQSLEAAQSVFEDTSTLTPAANPPRASELTDEQVGRAMAAFPMLEEWMKSVRQDAYDRQRRGVTIPGWKLVRKQSNRKWLDEAEACLAMRSRGINPFADPKILSPAQAEKLMGKGAVAELAYKPDAGTVLAQESDKRPAVGPSDVFTPVTESNEQ